MQFTQAALFKNLSNIPGKIVKRKLVVFESDDWGSIRMPSKDVYDKLGKNGIDLNSDDGHRYNKVDSLATSKDLSSLFEVLSSVKDCTGREVVFTPESVVANPDFFKIQESNFSKYFYEPFTTTLQRQANCENSFSLWKEGIQKRIFVPQFHGREHLNVMVWMRALKMNNEKARLAFDHGFWGFSTAHDPEIKLEFQAAFDFIDPEDLKYHEEVIESGLNLFEDIFGFRASYFVPPNGPLSSKLEGHCSKNGIKYLSLPKVQIEPLGGGKIKKRIHWIGEKSNSGLTYLTRNCLFEPVNPGRDWVDTCLSDISTAFRWHKPAIISTHRLNFIGALDKENRDNGLKQLTLLLNQIMKNWPDVEFLTSAELGKIINND